MKKLTCEMCGGTNLIKQDGVFVCQNCGTKYSVEEARKMMVEGIVQVNGTVQIDSSNKVSNLLALARRAKESGNNTEAESYANQVLEINPNDWEACFIKGVSAGWQSTLASPRISEALNLFARALYLYKTTANKGQTSEARAFSSYQALEKATFFEIGKLAIAMVSLAADNYSSFPSVDNASSLMQQGANSLNLLASAQTSCGMDPCDSAEAQRIISVTMHNAAHLAWAQIYNDYTEGKPDGVQKPGTYHDLDYSVYAHPSRYDWETFTNRGDAAVQVFLASAKIEPTADVQLQYDEAIYIAPIIRDSYTVDTTTIFDTTTWVRTCLFSKEAIAARNGSIERFRAEQANALANHPAMLAALNKRVEDVRRRRINAYWADHPQEHDGLGKQIRELNAAISTTGKQIESLKATINQVAAPAMATLNAPQAALSSAQAERNRLQAELDSLNLFQMKDKKRVQSLIDAQDNTIRGLEFNLANATASANAEADRLTVDLRTKLGVLDRNYRNMVQQRENAAHRLQQPF